MTTDPRHGRPLEPVTGNAILRSLPVPRWQGCRRCDRGRPRFGGGVVRGGEMAVTGVTPEKVETILDALRERPSFAAACRKAHISRQTFYRWRREHADFDAAVLKAREEGLDALEDALAGRALKNDTTAAIFLLKSHRREVYGDRVVGTAESPLHITITRVTRSAS